VGHVCLAVYFRQISRCFALPVAAYANTNAPFNLPHSNILASPLSHVASTVTALLFAFTKLVFASRAVSFTTSQRIDISIFGRGHEQTCTVVLRTQSMHSTRLSVRSGSQVELSYSPGSAFPLRSCQAFHSRFHEMSTPIVTNMSIITSLPTLSVPLICAKP
jgi:hypothetical protein